MFFIVLLWLVDLEDGGTTHTPPKCC